MLAQFGANATAVWSVVKRRCGYRFKALGGLAVAAVMLGGCLPTGVPLAGPDPADPTAKVASAGYRSTIAPYNSLRPTVPTGWREQNNRAAPPANSGQ